MKKLLLTIIAILITSITVFGQHNVKLNLYGLVFKEYTVGYEYILSDKMSTGVSVSTSFWDPNRTENLDYSSFKISPEFTYYTSPRFGADRFFLTGYLVAATEKYKDLDYSEYDNTTNTSKHTTYDFSNVSLGLGLGLGYKWAFNSGVYIEILFAGALKIVRLQSFSDEVIEEKIRDEYPDLKNYTYNHSFDPRFHLSVGYRFGGY